LAQIGRMDDSLMSALFALLSLPQNVILRDPHPQRAPHPLIISNKN